MSYSEFISTFQSGIDIFLNSLYSFSNNLIHNYIFITILCIILFSSFLFFFIDTIYDIFNFHIKNNIDDYLDGYNNLDRFQRFKHSWYNKNRELVYNSKIDSIMVSKNANDIVNRIRGEEDSRVARHRYVYSTNPLDPPEWFYTDIKGKPLSKAEEKELTDLLSEFKD